MKKVLHCCFSQFGKILDVVVMSKFRLRGQAWVVFDEIEAATKALKGLQGFPLYEKPIKIQYAYDKSDAIAKRDGTFKPRDKEEVARINKEKRERLQRKRGAKAMEEDGGEGGPQEAPARRAPAAAAEPHHILFVENLPEATTSDMLSMLFKQFNGFKEVRMVPAKPGISFVEFGDAMQAGVALNGLQGFKITPEKAIQVTFGKK